MQLQQQMNNSVKRLVFAIEVHMDLVLSYTLELNGNSLSKRLFHQMIRPFFVEQLYLENDYFKNEPYHHE